jgi:O-methyltransferase
MRAICAAHDLSHPLDTFTSRNTTMFSTTYSGIGKGIQRIRQARRRLLGRGGFEYTTKAQWWVDQAWAEPYRRFLNRDAVDGHPHTRILDRRFQLAELARSVSKLRGCTAECGVFRGVGSGVICQTLAGTYQPGEFHLGFDSWDGVSQPDEADRMPNGEHAWHRGKLRTPMQATQELLSVFDFCKLTQGWIPQCLGPAEPHRFRLLHIDVDLRQPTWDSLEFFYPRMVAGGVIVLDDHGFSDCPGARSAAIDFFVDKPESIVEVPTGQAFIYKR